MSQLIKLFLKRLQQTGWSYKIAIYSTIGVLAMTAGCGSTDRMDAYPAFTDLAAFPPVILVGRISSCLPIGSPRPSKWDNATPYQRFRLIVAVENILEGNIPSSTADIYFMVNVRSSGPPKLGITRYGGIWKIGDREIFFLQLDSGRLRTVCDTWAHCVVPVLSGFHEKVQPGLDVGDRLAYILFTRGKGATDDQMVTGLTKAVSIGFSFAPSFSITKLEELVMTETPPVREAACKYLRRYSTPTPFNDLPYMRTLPHDPKFLKAIAACSPEKRTP